MKKNNAVSQQDDTIPVEIGENNDDAILSLLATHNPSQSPIVEKFLRAFYAGQRGTCLQILNEGEFLLLEKSNMQLYRKEIVEATKAPYIERIKQVSAERDTYAQFYYSVLDVIAQTPALMAFSKAQLEDVIKMLIKAARKPWKEPGSWSIVGSALLGLVKVLSGKKTRELLGKYLKRVDFKSPFFLMIEMEKFPKKFESLKPYMVELKAAGENYAEKREAYEINKMPGDTYEEKRGRWLDKKEKEAAELAAKEAAEEAALIPESV